MSKSPSYSLLKVYLDPGEAVTSEPGAMVSMRGNVNIKTHTGGFGAAIMRAIVGGETIFINTYVAEGPAEVWFAPAMPGDIAYVPLNGSFIIQDFGYLAHHGDIQLTVAWRGFRGLLAGGGGLIWLKAQGTGGVWVTSFGGIEEVELGPNDSIIVDNFHFVGMSDSIRWSVRKFGGLKSFLLGGEGIVIEARGPGKLYLQTRSLPPFVREISKLIKK